MSAKLEHRLREILRERRSSGNPAAASGDTIAPRKREGAAEPPSQPDSRLRQAADALGGELVERDGGAVIVVDTFYPADHQHGLLRIGDVPGRAMAVSDEIALLGGVPEPLDAPPRRLLFVDLETTGLSGGAGTYAFLVGCGFFEPHGFRVRQYVMPAYQHERRLLAEVEALVRASAGLVSYNGKSFDVPVLETRYQFNRLQPPFGGLAHVDMLHTARRFWRGAAASPGAWPDSDGCRLGTLERTLFGVRRIGDVPGFEIPGRYFGFIRSGDAAPLEPVLEHNRLDIVSLAAMTARAVELLKDAPRSSRSSRESLGAGRLFERSGRLDVAERCYEDAVSRASCERGHEAPATRAEALRALAIGFRRAGRHADAARAWQSVVDDRRAPAPIRREALEALAIHFEHRSCDLDEARRFARLSLAERVGTRSMDDGRHRLARLDRKLGSRHGEPGFVVPPSLELLIGDDGRALDE